jgi:serine/threonine protein kinase
VILLDPYSTEPSIKLLDFGLSAVLLQGERRQQPVGSVAFLSPEIVREQAHDFATDIWSLGIVLYTLLTGRMPFVTKTKEKTLFNIKYKDINMR